jgi:Ca-activated chloride channel homolog
MDAKIKLDHQLLALEGEHAVHCMLELDVPLADGPVRAPLRIALVIDRSGSMHGPKLAAAKACAAFLARRLQPTDELAVIAYDEEVMLVHPLAPVGPETFARIAAIQVGGQTNLSGGWLKGLEELDRASDGVRRVILLTDGQANVGITSGSDLASIAAGTKNRAATSTVGFGDGFDEDLLAAISDASGGASYFAETPDDAPAIFAEEFEGLTSLVAQNLSVEIRPSDRVDVVEVLNEYPVVSVPGGLQVQLGDAYGGEHRRVVFQLWVPELARLGPARVADVVLRYVTVGAQVAAHESVAPVTVNLVSADEAAAQVMNHEVVEEVVLLRAARARRVATRLADQGDYDGAHKTLADAGEQLRRLAPNSARATELVDEAQRLDGHSASMSVAGYDSLTRKHMVNESRRRGRGRKD